MHAAKNGMLETIRELQRDGYLLSVVDAQYVRQCLDFVVRCDVYSMRSRHCITLHNLDMQT